MISGSVIARLENATTTQEGAFGRHVTVETSDIRALLEDYSRLKRVIGDRDRELSLIDALRRIKEAMDS